LVAALLGVVVDVALVSVDVVPLVVAVTPLPVVEVAPVAELVLVIPLLADIDPLPLIRIGGHGFIAAVLPVAVCCAFAVAAIAAVSASDKLAARHRELRCVVPRSVDIVSSVSCPRTDRPSWAGYVHRARNARAPLVSSCRGEGNGLAGTARLSHLSPSTPSS
jgi:hypothetical protein